MQRIPLMAVTLASVLYSFSAQADTTKRLFEYCLDLPRKSIEHAYCDGYIAGVRDIVIVKRQALGCSTDALSATSAEQLTEDFLIWARQHTERWNEPAYESMLSMLERQFPCPQASRHSH